MKVDYLAEVYGDYIKSHPNWKLREFTEEVKRTYEVNISVSMANRTKQYVLGKMNKAINDHYSKLWDYRDELLRANPGSTIDIQCETQVVGGPAYFKRFYVCFESRKKGWMEGCRPIIGLDGCFLKGYIRGMLLAAVGRDPNNQMYPIAWAVVEGENSDSWGWFLVHLIRDLQLKDGRGLTIISDQCKGLEFVIKEMIPHAEHRMCARHIYANWRKRHPGLELKRYFWGIAKACNEPWWRKGMDDLESVDKQAHDALMGKEPKWWCRSFLETTAQCDNVDNNMSEAFNGSILVARAKPIILMLEDIRHQMMERISSRRKWMAKHWSAICPRPRRILDNNKTSCAKWYIRYNGDKEFECTLGCQGFVVDLEKKSCTCREWDLTGIPCQHGVAVIFYVGYLAKQPEHYISEAYSKDKFMKAYKDCLRPINEESMWKKSSISPMLAPLSRRMPVRPRKNRIKDPSEEPKRSRVSSEGVTTESVSRVGRTMKCKRCGIVGHNQRGCPGVALPSWQPKMGRRKSTQSKQQPLKMFLYQRLLNQLSPQQVLNPPKQKVLNPPKQQVLNR